MADGSEKPISAVKPGDVVGAGDAQRRTQQVEPVEQVIVGHGLKQLVAVRVAHETIDATYNHPFWVVEDQNFEWANHLKQ